MNNKSTPGHYYYDMALEIIYDEKGREVASRNSAKDKTISTKDTHDTEITMSVPAKVKKIITIW